MGHVRDLPEEEARGRRRRRTSRRSTRSCHGKKVLDELKAAAKDADDHLPRPRPRPRGRGHRLAPRRGARRPQSKKKLRRVVFNEITKKAIERGVREPGRRRREEGRRAAGPPHPRPPGRLQGQPAPLGQGAPRPLGRPRAVGGAAAHLRARARDPGLRARGVLDGRGPPRGRGAARPSRPTWSRRTARRSRSATPSRPRAVRAATSRPPPSGSQKVEAQGAPAQPGAALHHLASSSRRRSRSSASRSRRRCRWRSASTKASSSATRARRPHHLHAHRLDARLRRRARRRCASTSSAPTAPTYLPEKPIVYKTQEGRPGRPRGDPADLPRPRSRVGQALSRRRTSCALYKLIWNRFVASQMKPAVYDETAVDIEAGALPAPRHRLDPQVRRLPRRLRGDPRREARGEARRPTTKRRRPTTRPGGGRHAAPAARRGRRPRPQKLDTEQHFTQPPPRFTEATLVKELEENGIGRPSTYASIIATIEDREYMEKREAQALPDRARLPGHRPARRALPGHHERRVHRGHGGGARRDRGGQGQPPQHPQRVLEEVREGPEARPKRDAGRQGQRRRPTRSATSAAKPMVIKWGRYGKFLACSGYPECKNTRQIAGGEGDGHARGPRGRGQGGLPEGRPAHGPEEGPLRPLPRLHALSRVQDHASAWCAARAASCRSRSWRRSTRSAPSAATTSCGAAAASAPSSPAATTRPASTSRRRKPGRSASSAPSAGRARWSSARGAGAASSTAAGATPSASSPRTTGRSPSPAPTAAALPAREGDQEGGQGRLLRQRGLPLQARTRPEPRREDARAARAGKRRPTPGRSLGVSFAAAYNLADEPARDDRRRRPRRLRGRLAARAPRRRRRPPRDAPGARPRRSTRPATSPSSSAPTAFAATPSTRPPGCSRRRCAGWTRWSSAWPTRCGCRPAAPSRSTAASSPGASPRRSRRCRASRIHREEVPRDPRRPRHHRRHRPAHLGAAGRATSPPSSGAGPPLLLRRREPGRRGRQHRLRASLPGLALRQGRRRLRQLPADRGTSTAPSSRPCAAAECADAPRLRAASSSSRAACPSR